MSVFKILDLLYGTKAEITSKKERHIYYKATSPTKLDDNDICNLQMNLGYHPAGYGLYNICSTLSNDVYTYTWSSSTSCD